MAKTQKKPAQKAEENKAVAAGAKTESLKEKLVLNGADITLIGEEAELLVGGKNYNTAIISQVQGIRRPNSGPFPHMHFIPSLTKPRSTPPWWRATVDKEYNQVDWHSDEVNRTPSSCRASSAMWAAKSASSLPSSRARPSGCARSSTTWSKGSPRRRRALTSSASGRSLSSLLSFLWTFPNSSATRSRVPTCPSARMRAWTMFPWPCARPQRARTAARRPLPGFRTPTSISSGPTSASKPTSGTVHRRTICAP